MEKYAMDIRMPSGKFLTCQGAFYSAIFPSNNAPHVRPPKKKDTFAPFKPDPQLLAVPGMNLLGVFKSFETKVVSVPIPHGFLCGINAMEQLADQLRQFIETFSVLSRLNQQLEELKKKSLVRAF
jgi:hypothetical protein